MIGETAEQALMRAATVAGWRAGLSEADRRAAQRVLDEDEDGNPRAVDGCDR